MDCFSFGLYSQEELKKKKKQVNSNNETAQKHKHVRRTPPNTSHKNETTARLSVSKEAKMPLR